MLTTTPTAATATPYRWRWLALATLLLAEAMNLLDTTIVQVAAPVIHQDLGGSTSDLQWYGAAYTLPFAVLLITGGRIGDIAGRARAFRLGVSVFVLASLACACAPAPAVLIGARAVQGAAAAFVIPQTIGLIRAMFDGPELPKALGTIGPVMGLAAVTGPVLGGTLTEISSWRSVFLVNVPLGVAVLVASRWLLEDRAEHRPRLDLAGTGLATLGTGLIVYPLVQGNTAGWPAWTWIALAAGVAVLLLLALRIAPTRTNRPVLVEPSLFHNRGFPAALVSSVLFFSVMNGLMLVVVLQSQLNEHHSVLRSGLTLLPWSCGMAISSWTSGAYLYPRYGSRLMFAGLATLFAGCLGLVAAYSGHHWTLLPALAIGGLGLGMFTTPFFSTALARVRPHETGSAAGLLNSVQQLGGTLGIAALGTVFFHGPQNAVWVAAAVLVATAGSAAFMRHS
ncbi:MFS transporter [Actinomadura barringtoniae]|uniref:MFS transporter n=1 Tax=Actinomadura barringtoniae TaxID=1427535 RepID=A0A939PFC0_9ACTN|nr:MFS transporter [Actinomadura barringtoniae]MBO2451812.1 MFS transporter [Actinomadura barringtoniae]